MSDCSWQWCATPIYKVKFDNGRTVLLKEESPLSRCNCNRTENRYSLDEVEKMDACGGNNNAHPYVICACLGVIVTTVSASDLKRNLDKTRFDANALADSLALNMKDWSLLDFAVGACFNTVPRQVTFLNGPLCSAVPSVVNSSILDSLPVSPTNKNPKTKTAKSQQENVDGFTIFPWHAKEGGGFASLQHKTDFGIKRALTTAHAKKSRPSYVGGSKGTAKKTGKKRVNSENWEACVDLGPGWRKEVHNPSSGGKPYNLFHSPGGTKHRSHSSAMASRTSRVPRSCRPKLPPFRTTDELTKKRTEQSTAACVAAGIRPRAPAKEGGAPTIFHRNGTRNTNAPRLTLLKHARRIST